MSTPIMSDNKIENCSDGLQGEMVTMSHTS